MILLFGGTTEGRLVAEILDHLSLPYYYSTKNKVSYKTGGVHIFGAKEVDDIITFCKKHQVRLIIDAAHPFAIELHRNIYEAAGQASIPTIRFERPEVMISRNEDVRYFNDFPEMISAVQRSDFKNILALTGVQTILKLKPLWQTRNCYFRIMDTPMSHKQAVESGIFPELLYFQNPGKNIEDLVHLSRKLDIELILTKESGESGFFTTKVEACRRLNIPLWVVKKPVLPEYSYVVSQQKELLRLLLKLRRDLLKDENELRQGYTTGTCVTAAVKACFMALTYGVFPKKTEVTLPGGEKASFMVFDGQMKDSSARCVVVKDGGDDPDVTHAHEIGCELSLTSAPGVRFLKGEGVGIVTLPGLQIPVGEPAINPVPRQMITAMLQQMASKQEISCGFEVKPFVPKGEELAKRTFNPRLGVVGGISVIGTSGIVHPYSHEAYLASIRQQISVAAQNGNAELVLTSGKRSENLVKSYFQHLPDSAFVHFGNSIGDALNMINDFPIAKVTLVIMLGKAVKLAEGHLDTHSRKARLNNAFLSEIAVRCGCSREVIQKIESVKLANEILDVINYSDDNGFYQALAQKCFDAASPTLKKNILFQLCLLLGTEYKIWL